MHQPALFPTDPPFDGETFEPEKDQKRLGLQLRSVLETMIDGQWRSLYEIADLTFHPESSVSARLRDLRKPKFGGYTVERKRVDGGLFLYRLLK